jgi:hypothetical protein
MGTTSKPGDARSPRWSWALVGVGLAVAVALAGALWIFAATFYGQMQETSDWHMAGPIETMTFAEDHGIDLYAPGGEWPGSDSEVESALPNVCAHVTHTYTRVAGEYEIDVSASPASCGGPGGYLGSDDSAGRETVETPVGRAVLGDYEQQPEARIDTPTTSLFVGSLSDRIVPDDVFADFLRSLRAVSPDA